MYSSTGLRLRYLLKHKHYNHMYTYIISVNTIIISISPSPPPPPAHHYSSSLPPPITIIVIIIIIDVVVSTVIIATITIYIYVKIILDYLPLHILHSSTLSSVSFNLIHLDVCFSRCRESFPFEQLLSYTNYTGFEFPWVILFGERRTMREFCDIHFTPSFGHLSWPSTMHTCLGLFPPSETIPSQPATHHSLDCDG